MVKDSELNAYSFETVEDSTGFRGHIRGKGLIRDPYKVMNKKLKFPGPILQNA